MVQLRFFFQEWSRFDRARQHRKWRPLILIHESPKLWWKFAIERVLEMTKKRRLTTFIAKDTIIKRVYLLNAYSRAYRKKLESFLNEKNTSISAKKNEYVFLRGVLYLENF